MDDAGLDRLLAAARDRPEPPPEALERRVLADALRVQGAWRAARPGYWAQLREVLGGWPSLGGLAAACAAGVWLGLSPPSTLVDWDRFPLGALSAGRDVDLFDGSGLVLAMQEEEG